TVAITLGPLLHSTPCPYTTLFRSDPVGKTVDVAILDEGQALPDGVALKGGDGIVLGGVRVVGEDDVTEGGEALYVGDGQPVVGRSEETRLNSSHVKISYAVFCLKT